jgi:hypothetical protein
MGTQTGNECSASTLTLTFGTTKTLRALGAGRTLPPNQIHWHSFLLQADCNTRLLNADRKIRSLENFQGPQRRSKLGPKTYLNQSLFGWLVVLYL